MHDNNVRTSTPEFRTHFQRHVSDGNAPVPLLVVLPPLFGASHLKQEAQPLLRGEHEQICPEIGRLLRPHDGPRQEERSELPPKLGRNSIQSKKTSRKKIKGNKHTICHWLHSTKL